MSEPKPPISVDGEIHESGRATIALPDDGLYRGDGAFEVIRLYAGRPFSLEEHLDRLERSASTIELPVEREALEAEIEALVDCAGELDALLRVIVTRGRRRIVAIEGLPKHEPAIDLASVAYAPSVILTGAKTLSYGANMQATRIARSRGAQEALLVTEAGTVLEAPTSTIFWSAAGRLRTTAVGDGVLASITRAKLIERLEVEEGAFPLDDLLAAEEAFLASTTREVQPVSKLDGREYEGWPGHLTRQAAEAFQQALAAEL